MVISGTRSGNSGLGLEIRNPQIGADPGFLVGGGDVKLIIDVLNSETMHILLEST